MEEKNTNEIESSKSGENRLPNGRFKPGVSGNPNGRPSNPINEEIRQALRQVRADRKLTKGKTLWRHLVEQAYTDNSVALKIWDKLSPDEKHGPTVQVAVSQTVKQENKNGNDDRGEAATHASEMRAYLQNEILGNRV